MNVVTGEFPHLHIGFEQWVCWMYLDGRKQPFSPFSDLPRYSDDGDDKFSWSNTANWTDYADAHKWADMHPQLTGVGFITQHEHSPYQEPADPTAFIDFDDVRDPETGEVHPFVEMVVRRADSYADVSVSDTGVHILGVGQLPDGVRTIQDDLPAHPDFPDAEIEVYDGRRFVAMTGKWIQESNREVTDISYWLRRLARRFDTTDKKKDAVEYDSVSLDIDNTAFEDTDTTDDIDEVFDAIQSVGESDIRLRSREDGQRTGGKSDGVIDYDPAYRQSDSGTGLAWMPDRGVWMDRDGEHYMDALQLVALEEGIIHRPTDYPEGAEFWRAVGKLRDRGANIPRYTGNEYDRHGLHETPADDTDRAKQNVKKLEML